MTPYGDLYRQVCVEIVDECEHEEEMEDIRRFFPKYKGSKIKGMIETWHEEQGRMGNHNTGSTAEADRKDLVRSRLEQKLEEEEEEVRIDEDSYTQERTPRHTSTLLTTRFAPHSSSRRGSLRGGRERKGGRSSRRRSAEGGLSRKATSYRSWWYIVR
jgi:hypothetical protein